MSRPTHNTLLDMMDDGFISPISVAEMCLSWMDEDEIIDMLRANDVQLDFNDEEDEE